MTIFHHIDYISGVQENERDTKITTSGSEQETDRKRESINGRITLRVP